MLILDHFVYILDFWSLYYKENRTSKRKFYIASQQVQFSFSFSEKDNGYLKNSDLKNIFRNYLWEIFYFEVFIFSIKVILKLS